VGVSLDEPFRNEEKFREGAVKVMEIFAQVFMTHLAYITSQAGRGIGDHDRVSNRKGRNAGSNGGDATRHLVAE
jgi:hypothetical protein